VAIAAGGDLLETAGWLLPQVAICWLYQVAIAAGDLLETAGGYCRRWRSA
jgi:hypothetical protein